LKYSEATFNRIVIAFHASWSQRSKPCFEKHGPGCFVYDSNNELSEGIFYKSDMLAKYFPENVAVGLRQMLQASTNKQLVAAVVFEDKIVGATLSIKHY
jgi:hypothetical protein